MNWLTTRHLIDLASPRVMGIVNLTPDSFSDGGRHAGVQQAIHHCEALLHEGAHILDIGGESSRPGAEPVPAEEEWRRVEPVLKAALGMGCPVSLDTVKPELMRRALHLGVDIINDIQALQAPGAAELVASSRAGICLMHMQGEPRSMQGQTMQEADVVTEVAVFLAGRAERLRGLGIHAHRIVLDPGIGFGKTVAQNFSLLAGQQALIALGYPVLAGWSRKSSLGVVTGRSVEQRMAASIAAALAAVLHGARIVRVHDVAATVDALAVWKAAGLPAVAPAA
jgi:dihydropteroate synthase